MKSNKELKAEYKQMKLLLGVFQVENTVNGKVWIEGSANIQSRWNRHQTELKFGSHRNRAFQEDWNTHGSESFVFSIVSITASKFSSGLQEKTKSSPSSGSILCILMDLMVC